MENIQTLFCDMPWSMYPLKQLKTFRNGSEEADSFRIGTIVVTMPNIPPREMGVLETVGRRAVTEVVILLSMVAAIIETVVRTPFALIAGLAFFAIPSSRAIESEFCKETATAGIAAFFVIFVMVAYAITNIYKERIMEQNDDSFQTIYPCFDWS